MKLADIISLVVGPDSDVEHWSANLDDHWNEAVAEVGAGKSRVWRLYLAAARMSFARNMIQLHQVLAVAPDEHGSSGVPLRPGFDRT